MKDYKKILTKEEYHITREGGTETPYSGKYCNFFQNGTYRCICCDAPLFKSDHKMKSGGGWPDFTKAIKMVRSNKKDSYLFKEAIVPKDQLKSFFEKE